MDILYKYKKLIIVGIVASTIIVLVGYCLIQNNENNEDFENFEEFEDMLDSNLVENNMNVLQGNNSLVDEVLKIKVHISGEVLNPGVIEIDEGSRIIDAIDMAGGVTEEADISKINLAYILDDAMKVNIPNINDEEVDEVVSLESNNGNTKENKKIMININTASAEELQNLDGIGSSIALRIVTYRKENGKFNSIDDLKNISGIGDSKFDKIKNNIYVK